MVRAYVPDVGEIIWIDFDPQVGHEQAKRRPALVLTPLAYNRASGLAVVCPFTSIRKDYPFAIPTLVAGKEGALLADHVKSLDWRGRRASFLAAADAALLDRARQLIGVLLHVGGPSED
jgi:mRNA interferase MazF